MFWGKCAISADVYRCLPTTFGWDNKNSLQKWVYQLSKSRNHMEFSLADFFVLGLPTWPCSMSHTAWSHEEASQHLTMCGPAASWARMVCVQARTGFLQTDAFSFISDLVVGIAGHFKQGCLTKTLFNMKTSRKHLVRGLGTWWRMLRCWDEAAECEGLRASPQPRQTLDSGACQPQRRGQELSA